MTEKLAYGIMVKDGELAAKYIKHKLDPSRWKEFVRKEVDIYFDSFYPYLDKEYLDVWHIVLASRILNLDDL